MELVITLENRVLANSAAEMVELTKSNNII